MNITASIYTRTMQAFPNEKGGANYVLLFLVLLSACKSTPTTPVISPALLAATERDTPSDSASGGALSFSATSEPEASTRPVELLIPSTSKNPKEFALDLINRMETSPAKCGPEAENTPQVNWTCAEYKDGLGAFIGNWDKLITSAEVSLKHSYVATSDWMYFAINGEIDFYWKTYDLGTTQALVAYDPSELGNELIIGINPNIGSQIAAAYGSNNLTSLSYWLPVQE